MISLYSVDTDKLSTIMLERVMKHITFSCIYDPKFFVLFVPFGNLVIFRCSHEKQYKKARFVTSGIPTSMICLQVVLVSSKVLTWEVLPSLYLLTLLFSEVWWNHTVARFLSHEWKKTEARVRGSLMASFIVTIESTPKGIALAWGVINRYLYFCLLHFTFLNPSTVVLLA